MGMTGGELEDVIYGLLAGSDPQFKFKFKHDCNNYYDTPIQKLFGTLSISKVFIIK